MKSEINDDLSVQGILPYLSQDLQGDFSERIFIYDQLESTNITAKEIVLSGTQSGCDASHNARYYKQQHGTVIIADFQAAGKGRQGKVFHSPSGHGIYMSIILDSSELHLSTPTLTTALAAVSVCEAIEAVSDKVPCIKWVNDVFLDGKKVCGILTESVNSPASRITPWVIVGIGINFSTPALEFPVALRQIAGSVFDSETPPVSRSHLAAEVINRVVLFNGQRSEKGMQHCENVMLEKYRQRMFLLGKRVRVTGVDEPFEAVAVDVDDAGHLVVKKNNGEQVLLFSGEVSIKHN